MSPPHHFKGLRTVISHAFGATLLVTSGGITSRIRVCQTSVNSGEETFTKLAFCVQAGHFQWGRESMARVGVKNENVPPWIIGNLERNQRTSEVLWTLATPPLVRRENKVFTLWQHVTLRAQGKITVWVLGWTGWTGNHPAIPVEIQNSQERGERKSSL